MKTLGYALLLLPLLAGCRPSPGTPDYSGQGPHSQDDGGSNPDVFPGPFPFQAGQRRLGVGFYEGGRSDDIAIDNATTHVYLYEATVTMEPSTDRVEGRNADLLVHAGKAWLGFGIHWDTPRNMDTWKMLHVSLKSADPGFSDVKIGMNDADGSVQLDAKKYGYANDGQWHHLAIPVADFVAGGLALNAVNAPFVLIAGQGVAADKLLLDNLYFTTATTGGSGSDGGTDGGTEPDVLPGPFPYQQGQARLGVGFYEGGRSEDVVIDNATTHIYLYEATVTMEPSTERVEGRNADLLVHAGKAWLGLGIHWDTARDLSAWKTLHVSLKSEDTGFADVKIGMNDADGSIQLDVKKYGYANDGEWHHLAIPVADFVAGGLTLNDIKAPFVLAAGQGEAADKLLLDNLYFSTETTGGSGSDGGTDGGTEPEMLPGPFPYQQGQARLGVGFYEGGRSEDIVIDNTTTHVYLYEATVTIEPSTERIEGRSADALVHAGKAWLGLGIHWDSARDLSTWKTMHVSLNSDDTGFSDVKIGMNDTARSVQLDIKKYGYANDGQWHHLAIPVADFVAGACSSASSTRPSCSSRARAWWRTGCCSTTCTSRRTERPAADGAGRALMKTEAHCW
ncbi:hypothetical protein ACLESO_14025 [Pyxidicoccus sp. 3LG]